MARGCGRVSGVVPARTAPARLPRGVPACGPRSQVDHRSKYKRMILWYFVCLLDAYYTPVPKYRGSPDASSKHLSHTLNRQHTTQTGQATHRSVHARHPGRRCTSRCQCIPVPQSRVPGSAHGYRRPGQRPWPCTMRHKAKATTHMAQAPHARSGTLYPVTHSPPAAARGG